MRGLRPTLMAPPLDARSVTLAGADAPVDTIVIEALPVEESRGC
jgi:hypothetical protein